MVKKLFFDRLLIKILFLAIIWVAVTAEAKVVNT